MPPAIPVLDADDYLAARRPPTGPYVLVGRYESPDRGMQRPRRVVSAHRADGDFREWEIDSDEVRRHIFLNSPDMWPEALTEAVAKARAWLEAPAITTIGDRLRQHREDRGISQERLAELAGVSQPYVSQIESGIREATVPVLRRLCEALGVRMGDVVG